MTDTAVVFHDLSFVPEGDEVVVGRVDTGSYAVLPADGAALLDHLAAGMPPERAAAWYEEEYGEPVDVAEFLETLVELGFVKENGAEPAAVAPVRFRRLGRAAFAAPAWFCYAAVVLAWVVVAVGHDDVRPDPGQFFFTGSVLVVQLVITFGQLPLIFLHEAFHTLAGRRLGLPSRLGISNRYLYIVFETRMNGLLSVPREKRYLPFVAGMVCDVVVLALLGLTAHLTRTPDGTLSVVGEIAMAFAFTVVMRIVWQFQLYLRTDLYYVFATALRCHDLHDASTALLRNRVWRLLGRPHKVVDEERWSAHDRAAGRWYGPFVAGGVVVMLLLTVLGSLPVVLGYFGIVAAHLGSGRVDLYFWDAVLSLVVNVGQLALVAHLAARKRRQQTATVRSDGHD